MNALQFKKERKKLNLTQKQMAEKVGVKPRTVQNWEAGVNTIPKSVDYFLAGENSKSEDISYSTEKVLIPFYEDALVVGGSLEVASMHAVSTHNEMIDAGDWFRDAGGAMRVQGDSMHPNYPSGCIVAFKEVHNLDLILYGQDYIVETTEYRVLKRVQKAGNSTHLLLCSYNFEKDIRGEFIHECFEVSVDNIISLHRVLGKVERN